MLLVIIIAILIFLKIKDRKNNNYRKDIDMTSNEDYLENNEENNSENYSKDYLEDYSKKYVKGYAKNYLEDYSKNYSESYLKKFYKKDYLLTPTELRFYNILKQVTDKLNLSLFCQVSMYEVISCKDYKEFNRIRSKCIDFVITERNCRIRCCVELDDKSHNTQKRQKRDETLEAIFKSAEVNLIRVKVESYYSLEQLERIIKNNI